MNTIEYKYLEDGIVHLVLNDKSRSANIVSAAFVDDLSLTVDKLLREKELKGVVISSAKSDFLSGTDLKIITGNPSASDLFEFSEKFKEALRKLETMGKPVVSMINGACLGGGFELALATHFRIAINSKKIKIGLPDIKIGLLSAGGGITRLSRLFGLQKTFEYVSEGKELLPDAALELGWIHALVNSPDDLLPKAIEWIEAHSEVSQPFDMKGFKIPGGGIMNPKTAQVITAAPAMLLKKTKGNYPAPEALLSILAEGSVVDFDTALRIESRYFVKIGTGKVAKNMINTLRYQFENLKMGNSRPNLPPSEPLNKIGVLGAGMMGHGIAYVAALSGYRVVLKDVRPELAQKGLQRIEAVIEKRIARGQFSAERKKQVLERILPTAHPEDLKSCDLVIEAVFEDRELKAKATKEAESFMSGQGFFASNTSTLPISGLATAFSQPDKFIGLHFFSPVDKMQLVEIIKGKKTSDATLARAFDFVLSIRKIPIVVNDSRGFYTSRVFSTYVEEGLALLGEGQNPQCIESAGVAAGMPVGPLALTDEISLTLIDHINRQTEADLKAEGKTRPSHPADAVVEKMIHTFNRKGKASGAGFYDYPEGESKHLWSELSKAFPLKTDVLEQEEMIERLMFIQAIETVRCLEEGVLNSVADANIGSIFGWGFPAFKGGTLQFINDYGIPGFVEKTRELEKRFGKRFALPELLVEMASGNKVFE